MSHGCLIIEDEYILTEGESIMSSDFIRQSTDDDDDGVTIKTKKKKKINKKSVKAGCLMFSCKL